MKYDIKQIAKISDEGAGKIVKSLEHDDKEDYWVMTFTDGSEICFRFMSELI